MLKFFFHRAAWMVRLANAVAGILAVCLLVAGWFGLAATPGFFTYFLIFTWFFFNFLDLFPWYSPRFGRLGIRIHFQKNTVPVSYLCAFAFALKLGGAQEWVLAVFFLLMLPIYYVSLILLSFHGRDRSTLMPSYFSHNYYLQHKEPAWSPSPSSDSVLEN